MAISQQNYQYCGGKESLDEGTTWCTSLLFLNGIFLSVAIFWMVGCGDPSLNTPLQVGPNESQLDLPESISLAATVDTRQTLISTASNDGQIPSIPTSLPNLGLPPVVKVDMSKRSIFGIPIAQFSDEIWLMRNDGAIQRIERPSIVQEQILPVSFEPIATDRLVSELRKEFGPGFQVRAEAPYVFVMRNKTKSQWVEGFRSLYASMKQFCRKNALPSRKLDFPLIAIVMSSEAEFLQYARAQNADIPPNCGGYYSQRDNRIILFEDQNNLGLQEVRDTISHEAAHQLAFNMGLHQRCSGTPLWLAEGFATLFEAPAYCTPIGDGRSHWPAARKMAWQSIVDDESKLYRIVDSLLRNDNTFRKEPEYAYAVSWGLVHYLATERSHEFSDFLRQLGQLPPFVEFSVEDRFAHFRSSFKIEPSQLIRRLQNHIRSL